MSRSAGALSAGIDGEVVALNIAKGLCYGLDPIGARIWALIESPVSLQTVCDTLVAEYAVDFATCLRDVADLVADLNAEGLVDIGEPAPMERFTPALEV